MTFRCGKQRVVVSDPIEKHEELRGKCGTVVRLLFRNKYEAWVRMDEPLPVAIRVFGPEDDRADHVLLYYDECEEV